MSAFRTIARRTIRSRHLPLVGFLLVGLMLSAAAFRTWEARETIVSGHRREITNLGIALAAQAGRSLQSVDLVLRETQRQTLTIDARDAASFELDIGSQEMHWFLARHAKNLPQADSIGVFGADGQLVNSSRQWPPPRVNVAATDGFQYLRSHDDRDLYISRLVRSPVSGEWTMYLMRRVDGPHGEFFGVATAGIAARYFEEFYRGIALEPGAAIDVFARDGSMVASYPEADAMMGKQMASRSPWFASLAQGGGSYSSPADAYGPARLASVVPLHDYPLVLTVSIPEDAILGQWRRFSVIVVIGAGSLALGFIFLVLALAARSRRLEQHGAALAESAAALRASEAKFRDFAVTSSDWFWETDEDHRVTFVSESIRAFGGKPDLYIGRSRIDLAAPPDRDQPKWDDHIVTLTRHEPFRNFIYTALLGDGQEQTVSISGRPFFDADGRFLGYRGTGRDITAEFHAQQRLEEAKAAAEEANSAKSQFLANVSHELRTPLNAIIGFAEMMELGMVGALEPRQTENIHIIRLSGEHLHRVINDILDLAKVDAGKLDLYLESDVDPRTIVDACRALVKERVKEAQLSLWVELDPALPLMVADTLRLKQILLNLLSNAIKFTEAGGSILIAVQAADGDISFEVRDTGAGMTADEIKIASEPFGQVDGGLGRRHEGTGLGLPLARRLAELHGGRLDIESEKGRGTTVTVTLPAARSADAPSIADQVEAVAA
jgi:PAS domain S-box-containing protein